MGNFFHKVTIHTSRVIFKVGSKKGSFYLTTSCVAMETIVMRMLS